MKKLLAMVLTVVMLIGCLAGCGEKVDPTQAPTNAPKTEAPATDKTEAPVETEKSDWLGTEDGKTITLRFWSGVQPEYGYDQLAATFNEEYKDRGLQVEYVRYVNNTEGNLQLETYLMGGGEVDLFIGYGGRSTLDARKDSGLLLDMSDMLEARGFDLIKELGEANMAAYIWDDGATYGFPTKYENGRWLLANVDMFKAAGVEIPYDGWTYSEFLAAIEKLTTGEGANKVYGMNFNFKQEIAGIRQQLASVLGGFEMYTDESASAVNYDHPVWKKGFELVKAALDGGWAIPIEDCYSENITVANSFLEGKCAITSCISQMRLCMDTATYPHDFATALIPFPVPDDAEYQTEYYKTHASCSGAGDAFCIAANTEYPEQCMEFALWYVTGGMAPLAKGGRIPLWSGFEKEDVIGVLKANAEGKIDMESMNNYLAIDNTKGVVTITGEVSDELRTMWQEEFEAMCYGRQSIDDTIKNMVERGNDLIAKGR